MQKRLIEAWMHARDNHSNWDVLLVVDYLGIQVDVRDPNSERAHTQVVSWLDIEDMFFNPLIAKMDEMIEQFPKAN